MIGFNAIHQIAGHSSSNIAPSQHFSSAEEIANDYQGDNVSGKNEKENIDKSLSFFDQYNNSPENPRIGNSQVQAYVTGLINDAVLHTGIDLELLKSFVAVHDGAKLTKNLEKLGHEVTTDNKKELYAIHDNLTADVMRKVYNFTPEQVKLFEHPNIRAVVDCFDVLGNSPFLTNVIANGKPLLQVLLDSKALFDSGLVAKNDNLAGIAKVVGVSSQSSPKNIAEAVFKRQFYITPGPGYTAFKKENTAVLDNFLENMVACRDRNILISNPRILFETLGHQIPQSFKTLDKESAVTLASALENFNKIFANNESVTGQITNRDGTKAELTASFDSKSVKFTPNRFHYTQGMELFSVPNAKVEGDMLDTNGSISTVQLN